MGGDFCYSMGCIITGDQENMVSLTKRDYIWLAAVLLVAAAAWRVTTEAQRTARAQAARTIALEEKVARLEAALHEARKQAEQARAPVIEPEPELIQETTETDAAWPLDMEEILRAPEGVEVREVDPAHLPPAAPAERAQLGRLVARDAALDREFNRLERRAAITTDEVERDYVLSLKERLLAVSALFDQLEDASPEERAPLQRDVQAAIGEVIRLSRTDRNHRLAEYARSIGLSGHDDIIAFVQDVEAVFRDTDTDWSRLLQTGR